MTVSTSNSPKTVDLTAHPSRVLFIIFNHGLYGKILIRPSRKKLGRLWQINFKFSRPIFICSRVKYFRTLNEQVLINCSITKDNRDILNPTSQNETGSDLSYNRIRILPKWQNPKRWLWNYVQHPLPPVHREHRLQAVTRLLHRPGPCNDCKSKKKYLIWYSWCTLFYQYLKIDIDMYPNIEILIITYCSIIFCLDIPSLIHIILFNKNVRDSKNKRSEPQKIHIAYLLTGLFFSFNSLFRFCWAVWVCSLAWKWWQPAFQTTKSCIK